jgi:hypothetical protein
MNFAQQVVDLVKAWTDEAREAAEYHQQAANRNEDENPKASVAHAEAAEEYRQASAGYREAEGHYRAGRDSDGEAAVNRGNMYSKTAEKLSAKANRMKFR